MKRYSIEDINLRKNGSSLNISDILIGNINKSRKKTVMKKDHILHKIEGLSEKIKTGELDIHPFNKKELKDIIVYYIYLREEIANKKQSISVEQYLNITSIDSKLHKPVKSDKLNKKTKTEFTVQQYIQIALKKSGETFGEVALQHSDSKRTATMITHTDCIMGYLTKGDYDTSIRDIELRKRQNDINFIMTFSIFNQMNWILFENKYFNYFSRQTYQLGQSIINIGQEMDKIYFIMDGQFEVKTQMTLKRLYSLIKYKTENKFKMKMVGKNSKINLRLYISHNKDIIGLDDCCYNQNISFICATCISNKSCVFILERNILNEMKHKIPEIRANLNNMIKERNNVMCNRLITIFMQTFQTNKMNKNIKKNDSTNNSKSTIKINNNYISTSKGHIRLKSCILFNNKNNKIADYFPTLNNISNIVKEKEEINFATDRNGPSSNIMKQNYNLSIYSPCSIGTVKTTNNVSSNIVSPNEKENKCNFSNDMDISYELSNKISEILNKKDEKISTLPIEKNNKFVLKLSEKLKKVSNAHTEKKFASLYSPINKIINKEYSNLFKWIDKTNPKINDCSKIQDYYSSSNDKYLKKLIQRYKVKNKSDSNSKKLLYLKNKTNSKNSFNNMKISQKILLQSSKKNREDKNLFKQKAKITYNVYDGLDEGENKSYKKLSSKKLVYNQTYTGAIKQKKVSSQFYMKQILGTKYKEDFSEKMDKKFKRILSSYDKEKKLRKQEGMKDMRDDKKGNKNQSTVFCEMSSRENKEIKDHFSKQQKISMFLISKSFKNKNKFYIKNKK